MSKREKISDKLNAISESGRKLNEEFTTTDGQKHVQEMIDDYILAINSLSSKMTADEAMKAITRIEYIRVRLEGWRSDIAMGMAAAERLKTFYSVGSEKND